MAADAGLTRVLITLRRLPGGHRWTIRALASNSRQTNALSVPAVTADWTGSMSSDVLEHLTQNLASELQAYLPYEEAPHS